jgi:SAM-dependent methyltransferase
MKSRLQENPRSVIVDAGYINVYSELGPKEMRQIMYKRRYKAENPEWDDSMVYLSNLFSALCGPDCVVLDAGCGNGNYVIDENRKTISWAAGADVSEEAVSKNICLDEIKICDLESLPYGSDTFDVVISLWVLEHLKDPEKVFSEVQRVLKPGGIFMFATPNISYLPLKMVQSVKIGGLLNRILFGREEEDIFPAFYKANTIPDIERFTKGKFESVELRLNSDVSYTSFNNFTYSLSKWFTGRFPSLNTFTHPHIIGVFRRK